MFITNFSLYLHNQSFYSTISAIIWVIIILFSLLLIFKKDFNILGLIFVFSVMLLMFIFPALKPNEYKLTIAYVNVNDDNKTMTKDVVISTLLNDGIYPKYNIKYKTSKETFKLTKEEYEKLSEIYYDDLNNRRWI